MQRKKIIVSVSNDLTNDQRVNRICHTLQSNGYDVLVICRKLKNSENIGGRIYKIKRFNPWLKSGFLSFINFNILAFFYLLFHKTDILLSNDLDTLLFNTLIHQIKKCKLIYDSHELFTEAPEMKNSAFKRKIWLKIEKLCIKKTNASYTVSAPIADFYNKKYGIKMQLVRNMPIKKTILIPYEEREDILIYQGALNMERGIEILIESLLFLPQFKLYIAGKGCLKEKLVELTKDLNLEERVLFTGNLDFEKLHNLTCKAKIGFSIEQGKSLNYYYALPNKIFDYVQAGVPVICSNFPEMKKIIENYHVGEVFTGSDAKDLSKHIEALYNHPDKLNNYYNNCLSAKKILNWENEEKKLLEIFSKI